MKTNPRKQEAMIQGIFISTEDENMQLRNCIPVKQDLEALVKKLNDDKWDAFKTGRLKTITKRSRSRHDREYAEYQRLLKDINNILKILLN